MVRGQQYGVSLLLKIKRICVAQSSFCLMWSWCWVVGSVVLWCVWLISLLRFYPVIVWTQFCRRGLRAYNKVLCGVRKNSDFIDTNYNVITRVGSKTVQYCRMKVPPRIRGFVLIRSEVQRVSSSGVAMGWGGGVRNFILVHDSIKPPVWSHRFVSKFVWLQLGCVGLGPRLRCAHPRTVRVRSPHSPPVKLDSDKFDNSTADRTISIKPYHTIYTIFVQLWMSQTNSAPRKTPRRHVSAI